MILLPCPWCGPRDGSEFSHLGQTPPRPDPRTATPAQWRGLCQLIGRPEASSRPELATALSRLQHADEVDALLRPALARRTSAEWVADGLAGRIPIVAMPQPHELPAQEHWRQRGSFSPLPGTNQVNSARGPTP